VVFGITLQMQAGEFWDDEDGRDGSNIFFSGATDAARSRNTEAP